MGKEKLTLRELLLLKALQLAYSYIDQHQEVDDIKYIGVVDNHKDLRE